MPGPACTRPTRGETGLPGLYRSAQEQENLLRRRCVENGIVLVLGFLWNNKTLIQ